MIIGNGMIAKVFKEHFHKENVLIFASGVSNSRETRNSEFIKELNMVRESIVNFPDLLFVYFSSCSIHNGNTMYSDHKISVENFIIENSKNYLILRLPIVLGKNQNKNQLIGYLFDKLYKNELVEVYKNANRYIIDSFDLPRIVDLLIDKGISKQILEVAFNNSLLIEEIILIIERISNIKFEVCYSEINSPYRVDNKRFLSLFNLDELKGFNLNLESMLLKYFIS
jgi:hypothetical protein